MSTASLHAEVKMALAEISEPSEHSPFYTEVTQTGGDVMVRMVASPLFEHDLDAVSRQIWAKQEILGRLNPHFVALDTDAGDWPEQLLPKGEAVAVERGKNPRTRDQEESNGCVRDHQETAAALISDVLQAGGWSPQSAAREARDALYDANIIVGDIRQDGVFTVIKLELQKELEQHYKNRRGTETEARRCATALQKAGAFA